MRTSFVMAVHRMRTATFKALIFGMSALFVVLARATTLNQGSIQRGITDAIP